MNTDKEKMERDMSKLISKHRQRSRYLGLFGIVAILIGFSVAITNVFHLTTKQVVTFDSLKTNRLIIDSLISSKDSITIQKTRIDSVKKFITEFITVKKTDSMLNKYFADTVQRYYLKFNFTLNQIIQDRKWFNTNYPKAKLVFNQSDITVNLKDKNLTEVFVDAIYYPDSLGRSIEIIYQIKLNKDNKIYFIRNLVPKK